MPRGVIIDHATSQGVRSGRNGDFQKLRQGRDREGCRESPFVRSQLGAAIHLSVNGGAAVIGAQLRGVVGQGRTGSVHSARRHGSGVCL